MTRFIVTWITHRDGGGVDYNWEDIECGDKLVEIYDALRKEGLHDFEIKDATIHVVPTSFSGELVMQDPEVVKKIE